MSKCEAIAGWEARAEEAHYRPGELADLFGLSPGYLRRVFRAMFGISLSASLNRLRLLRFRALVELRTPLKLIAALLGFNHISNLSRLFKRAVGISIRAYRRTLSQEYHKV